MRIGRLRMVGRQLSLQTHKTDRSVACRLSRPALQLVTRLKVEPAWKKGRSALTMTQLDFHNGESNAILFSNSCIHASFGTRGFARTIATERSLRALALRDEFQHRFHRPADAGLREPNAPASGLDCLCADRAHLQRTRRRALVAQSSRSKLEPVSVQFPNASGRRQSRNLFDFCAAHGRSKLSEQSLPRTARRQHRRNSLSAYRLSTLSNNQNVPRIRAGINPLGPCSSALFFSVSHKDPS